MPSDDNERRNDLARPRDPLDDYRDLYHKLPTNTGYKTYSVDDVLLTLELAKRGLSLDHIRLLTGVSSYTIKHWMALLQVGLLEARYPGIKQRATQLNHEQIDRAIVKFEQRLGDKVTGTGSIIRDRWDAWDAADETKH